MLDHKEEQQQVKLRQEPKNKRRELIVGGTIVSEPDAFPYFVAVGDYCGGTLIAPDIVLTAGHCKPKQSHLQDVPVRVGAHLRYPSNDDDDDNDFNNNKEEVFDIVDAVRHSRFLRLGDDEFLYDFSLLVLDRSSVLHPVMTINRDETVPPPGDVVRVLGLGDTHAEYPSRAIHLRQVDLTVVDHETCEQTHDDEGNSYQGRVDPSVHLCTFQENKDSCSYDSGGPLLWSDSSSKSTDGNDDNNYKLVGMVSWGMGCADEVFPGVNSRISGVSDWIDAQVCRLSTDPPADFKCGHDEETNKSFNDDEGLIIESNNNLMENPNEALMAVMGLAACFMLVMYGWRRYYRGDHTELGPNSSPKYQYVELH